MNCLEWVSAVADLIGGIGTGVAAAAAVFGINLWRKQLAGTSQYDTAKRLLTATFRLRDAIDACRSSYISSREMPGFSLDSPPDVKAEALEQAYSERFKAVKDAAVEFDVAILEAEVVLASSALLLAKPFEDIVFEISQAIDNRVRDIGQSGNFMGSNEEWRHQNNEILRKSGVHNAFSNRIEFAIKAIENFSKPYLVGRR